MSYELKNLLALGISIFGVIAKVQPDMSHEKKLGSRIVSCFFVGYSERLRGFRVYCPSNRNILETNNANFIEDIQNSESQLHKNFIFEEEHIVIPMIIVPNDEVIISFQHENTVVSIQDTNTVHPEVDHVNEIEPKNRQPHKCLGDQLGRQVKVHLEG